MKKLMLVVAGGIGYVLGTKAGRQRYEQLRGTFEKVKSDPRVQEKTQQAADLAREKAPVVKEKLAGAADAAATKVRQRNGSGDLTDQLDPESTVFQDNPGPQGDLP